jgi:hypothetical protein
MKMAFKPAANLNLIHHPPCIASPIRFGVKSILGFSVWMREKTAAGGKAKAFTFFTIYSFENSVRML